MAMIDEHWGDDSFVAMLLIMCHRNHVPSSHTWGIWGFHTLALITYPACFFKGTLGVQQCDPLGTQGVQHSDPLGTLGVQQCDPLGTLGVQQCDPLGTLGVQQDDSLGPFLVSLIA